MPRFASMNVSADIETRFYIIVGKDLIDSKYE
jgi:hypothetical protein